MSIKFVYPLPTGEQIGVTAEFEGNDIYFSFKIPRTSEPGFTCYRLAKANVAIRLEALERAGKKLGIFKKEGAA